MKLASIVLSLSVLAAPVAFAGDKSEWTGFLTDTHCGAKMASKDHSDACIEKCVKGGSKVHLVDDGDKKMYDIDDPSKVKGMGGKRITVKGELDSKTNTIKVTSAAPAEEKK